LWQHAVILIAARIAMPESDMSAELKALLDAAYGAFDRGDLAAARIAFDAVLAQRPNDARHQYMQGLTCKYLRDWPKSLAHNLRSIALHDEPDEASFWNAAIAATALGDWAEARRLWAACGIRVPDGDGPIQGDYGVVSLRLNPWGGAETLYARRIDPVRARLLNIPLPESGYRRGDIVLHDGASTGQRPYGDRWVPVLNTLQRLESSEFQTFATFISCPSQADLDELLAMRVPGIDDLEDWTGGIVRYCMRCSYGAPHRRRDADSDPHAKPDDDAHWERDRTIGIAAQSRHSVVKLLDIWAAKAPERYVDAIESREATPSSPPDRGFVWWTSPDDEDDDASDDNASDDDADRNAMNADDGSEVVPSRAD
jgi:hypothetical protein